MIRIKDMTQEEINNLEVPKSSYRYILSEDIKDKEDYDSTFVPTQEEMYNAIELAKKNNVARKKIPVYSGVLKYFPNAIKEVAKCSQAGNDQHHADKPLHWDKSKSTDDLDAGLRHLLDHTNGIIFDDDGVRHLAKTAWRILARLERELTGDI